MANIIRIRRLEEEFKLNNVLIPVDKDNYGRRCGYITILDLKKFILSAYNGDETYTSIPEAPYWTAGGIVAGDSRFLSGFTNVPVKQMIDWMLYSPTTTTTTLPPPTTTTTTLPPTTTTTTTVDGTTTTTTIGTTTTTTTIPPTTTTTTTLPAVIFGFDVNGNLDFSQFGGTTVSFTLTITAFASQEWWCDSPPQGFASYSYTINIINITNSVSVTTASSGDPNPSDQVQSPLSIGGLGNGTTQSSSISSSGNQGSLCGNSTGYVTLELSSIVYTNNPGNITTGTVSVTL